MQRTGVVILAVVAIAGCRSSAQPINPFIRTTVPPPGTGEAAVVVPGDPYYPGSTPTPSPQVMTPAPPVTQGTPVAPVPAQPAPPPTRDLKKAVPGGDLFYHQSSSEQPGQLDAHGQPVGGQAVNSADPAALALGGQSNAVADALALSQAPEAIQTVQFQDNGGRLPGEPPVVSARHESPPQPTAPMRLQYSAQQKVRVVGDVEDDSDDYEVDAAALEYDSSSLAAPDGARPPGMTSWAGASIIPCSAAGSGPVIPPRRVA